MELLLQDGDYVPDGAGGFISVSGGAEILQRVLFQMTARKGSFPLIPQLGSQLYLLLREKPSKRETLARQYVVEALAEESEVSVLDVALTESEENILVTVSLDYQGESYAIGIEI